MGCIVYLLIPIFFLVACKGSSSPTTSSSSTATLTVRSNQTISGYPHTIDYYIPSNAESVIIFLHGGGGAKESFANNLDIKNDSSTTNYSASPTGESWLITNKVMAVFPQGQHVAGQPLATTWSNYVMNSGANDVAFLQALVAFIKTDSGFSHITKFYLAGHSNGGMMANRMWCESPNTFDAYGALAGPPSSQLDAGGAHPCNPSTVKPYIGIVGNMDTQLQTSGNMNTATWSVRNYNGSSAAWVSSTVLNDLLYFTTRSTAKCSGSVSGPSTSGQLSTYTSCGNTLQEIIVSQITVSGQPSGGDHCLAISSGSGCVTTLTGDSGLDYKNALFNFFKLF